MHDLNFPHSLASVVFSLYDSSFYYVKMFVSEICYSLLEKFNKQEKWEPNNTVSDRFEICDWRGRCILMLSFQPLSIVFEDELATVGALLLLSEPSGDVSFDKFYSVHTAHVPICSFQGSFQSILFSFSEYTMKLFSADFLSSLMLWDPEKKVGLNDTKLFSNNTVDFVTKSTTNTKAFKQKCQHTMNLRKKKAEVVYFASLGYKYIFMFRTKEIDKNVETRWLYEMQEVIKKLGEGMNGSKINTAKWRTTTFLE